MKSKLLSALLSLVILVGFSTYAFAEWHFGVGTGPQLLTVDGDLGLATNLGPVEIALDLKADDIKDATDQAFGLAGYATNGDWVFRASAGQLQLEGNSTGLGPLGNLSASVDFDITGAELTGGYYFYKTPGVKLLGYAGARYLKHEMDIDITGSGFIGGQRDKSIDESWTDVLFGLSADVPFAEKWIWNVKTDAGFGGSEGTYMASTGVTWLFYGGWSANLVGKYLAVDYENDSKGDANWYMYDVDESTLGLILGYNW
jgi:hypothetical protein